MAVRSIQEIKIKRNMTSAGTVWDVNKASLPQQESLTVCQGPDLLAQGCVASCMDLLNQRLKSLEALGKGVHWTLCRQYEVVKVEEGGMTEETEKLGPPEERERKSSGL